MLIKSKAKKTSQAFSIVISQKLENNKHSMIENINNDLKNSKKSPTSFSDFNNS